MSDAINKQSQLVNELQTLTCFCSVESIAPITSGLSCYCFKVIADGEEFFAKYIESTPISNEVKAAQLATNMKLTPDVIYHNQQWLICAFINGDNLNVIDLPQQEKVTTALGLMAQCHTLKTDNKLDVSGIDIDSIITGLVNSAKSGFSSCQPILQLKAMASALKQLIESTSIDENITENVCCHGDLNFSNILIDDTNKAWLIDFECSIIAPAEYDIAMFIAINELGESSLPYVIEKYCNQYNKHNQQRYINAELISHYLLFCHFINALWYTNASINCETNPHRSKNNLKVLAKEQWRGFIRLANSIELSIDSSILEEFFEYI